MPSSELCKHLHTQDCIRTDSYIHISKIHTYVWMKFIIKNDGFSKWEVSKMAQCVKVLTSSHKVSSSLHSCHVTGLECHGSKSQEGGLSSGPMCSLSLPRASADTSCLPIPLLLINPSCLLPWVSEMPQHAQLRSSLESEPAGASDTEDVPTLVFSRVPVNGQGASSMAREVVFVPFPTHSACLIVHRYCFDLLFLWPCLNSCRMFTISCIRIIWKAFLRWRFH